LKGFEGLVGVHELIGQPDQAEKTREWREAFAEALSNYEQRNLEFAQIVKGMKGPINNKTFLAAASRAKIDLPGIVPKMDLSKPWGKTGGPAGLYRLFNRSVIYNKVKNGKIVPLTTKFEDVGDLAK